MGPVDPVDDDRVLSSSIPATVLVVEGWGRGIRAAADVVDRGAWASRLVPLWRSTSRFLLMMFGGVVGPRLPWEGAC